jgi:hypothetical protein
MAARPSWEGHLRLSLLPVRSRYGRPRLRPRPFGLTSSIQRPTTNFDPSEFRDRYEDALRALIDDKRKGKPVRPTKNLPTMMAR